MDILEAKNGSSRRDEKVEMGLEKVPIKGGKESGQKRAKNRENGGKIEKRYQTREKRAWKSELSCWNDAEEDVGDAKVRAYSIFVR